MCVILPPRKKKSKRVGSVQYYMLNKHMLLEALQKWRSWSLSCLPVAFSDLKTSRGFKGIVPSGDTVSSSMDIPTTHHQPGHLFPHPPSQLHHRLLKESPEVASKTITAYHCFLFALLSTYVQHYKAPLKSTSIGGNDYNGGFSSHFRLF